MCPIFADEGPRTEPEVLRKKLAAAPGDNLVRNDLAVALHLQGESEAALTVLSEGPSPGPGRGLVRINRFFMEWAETERENFAKQRTLDPRKKIKRIAWLCAVVHYPRVWV